jgi:hypothetical protein
MPYSTVGMLLGLICVGIFVLAFGGAGVFLIYRTRKNKQQADASQSWPSAVGQVIEAEVQHGTSTDSEGDRNDSYTPHIRYIYQINGADYSGDKISFGFVIGYGSESKARAILMKYPVGQQVTVFYDPADPGKAVLERKAGGSTVGIILGIVFLAVAFCIACPAMIAIPMGWFGSK